MPVHAVEALLVVLERPRGAHTEDWPVGLRRRRSCGSASSDGPSKTPSIINGVRLSSGMMVLSFGSSR